MSSPEEVADQWLDHLRRKRLNPFVELVASWCVCFFALIFYCSTYIHSVRKRLGKNKTLVEPNPTVVPLMTESGDEDFPSSREVYKELQEKLQEITPWDKQYTNAQLVNLVRDHPEIRRLVSRLMLCPDAASVVPNYQQFLDLWPTLLELPPLVEKQFRMGLVIPAYKESGMRIARTLDFAYRNCQGPTQVTVVVVDAGCNTDMEKLSVPVNGSRWGAFRVVAYKGGGGRGPTLNYGALCAHATFLSFLHSDTLLPRDWDVKIQRVFLKYTSNDSKTKNQMIAAACAFPFGLDASPEGLGDEPKYPWGIGAVQVLVNLRAYLFALPYGDQVISVPSDYFQFLGGFPNQPMMEDYEFMDVLRKRAKFLKNEKTVILSYPAAKCSVRRWKNLGTVYTTLVNALIVYRYLQGWKPTQIMEYYYRRPNKKKQ